MGNCISSTCCPSWQPSFAACGSCFKCQKKQNQDPEGNTVEIPLCPQPSSSPADQPDSAAVDHRTSTEEPAAASPEMFGRRRPRLPKPPADSLEEEGKTLKVVCVDLLVARNGKEHWTYDYDLMERPSPNLVIRRGQEFHLKLALNRGYQSANDAISFVFTVTDAKQPSPTNGTLMVVPLLSGHQVSPGGWSARIVENEALNLTVQIRTEATAIVGTWKMEIDTKSFSTNEALCFSLGQPIYLLFNPWCKDDQVYLDQPDWRDEYVLADSGLIWRGSYNRMRPCPWNFAQFERDILDCSVYLLSNVGKLTVAGRADPVRVTRAISAAVNSPDDNGVLEGNWSNDYSGGTAPTKWSGSMLILQKFWETKKPVQYGQCWVFSGVVTTVCRALGIPARSVTNFSSAHDTHGSLTIDTFVGTDGKIMEELNSDSIWNFHVWNEVWMTRPDLEPGDYGGWQAIDATPQEESDGLYRCGPASVAAIKRGQVRRPFDTAFQFAEVNADKIYWKYTDKNSPLKLIEKKTDEIGLFISTKAVGKFEREDITHLYKFPENSREEREVVLKALRQCENLYSRYYLNEALEDIKFDLQLLDDVAIGAPFRVSVTAENRNATKVYNVSVILRVESVLYMGRTKGLVKKEKFDRAIGPNSSDEIIMWVSYAEYAPQMADQCAFNVSCLASVLETDFEFFVQDDFRVRKPDIRISAPAQVQSGQEFQVDVSLKNPLPVALNRAKFTIEGAGLGAPQKILLPSTIGVGQNAKASILMTATKSGMKTIAAKFYSKELNDVDGFFNVQVGDGTSE